MDQKTSDKKMVILMIAGMIGCLFMGGSDWLMIYGDTAYEGKLAWLTTGVAGIEPWRNALATFFSFPAVIFYIFALLGIKNFIKQDGSKKVYYTLTTIGLTPWLCIHLLYTMILFTFGWLQKNGHTELSFEVGEAMFGQFAWIIPLGEVLMLLPFIYLFYLFVTKKTVFARWMALNNPLFLYIILKLITMVMKDTPFRLAFTNGLMSEAMLIWFLVFLIGMKTLKKN